jgi:Protein of unknown function (DUF4058)
MKSPFPGMDPFLECCWHDFHVSFLVCAAANLNRVLPFELVARIGNASINENDAERTLQEGFDVPLSAPLERRLEIQDAESNRVITVIELLSPVNKNSAAGRAAYRKKQVEYIQGMVNLVEIDLLRCGEFVLAMPEEEWPRAHHAPYKICIRRVTRPAIAAGIGIQLRDKLPNIAIPLRPHDRDAVLELQPIIDDCYRDGRYYTIDYDRPLDPPFSEDEQQWFKGLLKKNV